MFIFDQKKTKIGPKMTHFYLKFNFFIPTTTILAKNCAKMAHFYEKTRFLEGKYLKNGLFDRKCNLFGKKNRLIT